MKPNGLFYHDWVVHEPLFPRPADAVYCNYSLGIAGFKTPKPKPTLFYGTPAEFEQYIKERERPRINRSTMYDVNGRPS